MPLFSNLLTQGGPVMPLILLTALAGYALAAERMIVWHRWHWRERPLRQAPDGPALIVLLDAAVPSALRGLPFRAVLTEALAITRRLAAEGKAGGETAEAREAAIHAAVMTRLSTVESRISTIGWVGTILPLLGLLGTVSGMITTFEDLSVTTSRQVLSQGLSEALWTTEVGLIGALPLLAVHHLLGRLKSRWLNHLERALSLITLTASAPGAGERP